MEMQSAMSSAAMPTRTNYRWKVALLIFLVSFVAYMDRVNLSVATPVIMQEFGFTKIDMGFIQTCFFAGYALMQVPGGILADRFCPGQDQFRCRPPGLRPRRGAGFPLARCSVL